MWGALQTAQTAKAFHSTKQHGCRRCRPPAQLALLHSWGPHSLSVHHLHLAEILPAPVVPVQWCYPPQPCLNIEDFLRASIHQQAKGNATKTTKTIEIWDLRSLSPNLPHGRLESLSWESWGARSQVVQFASPKTMSAEAPKGFPSLAHH